MIRSAVCVAVWIAVVPAEISASNQTLTDDSPLTGQVRPLMLASSLPTGPMTSASLDRMFDAARARPDMIAAPEIAPVGASAGLPRPSVLTGGMLKETRHPLIVPVPRETAAYQRTFRYLLNHPARTDRYDEIIQEQSRRYGLDPRLIKAIIAAESEFNRLAVSPRGAQGLMQLMAPTAEEMGVPGGLLTDPVSNIAAGAAYMAHLFSRAWKRYKLKGVPYQDAPIWLVQRVIAAYNAGPRCLERTNWRRQTVDYVRKVLLFYRSKVTDIRRPPKIRSSELELRVIRFNTASPY